MKLKPENNISENSISRKKFYPSLSDYNHSKSIMKTLGVILTPLMIFSCNNKDIPVNNNKIQKNKVVESTLRLRSGNLNVEKTSSKLPILKEKKRSKTKVTADTIIHGDKIQVLHGQTRRVHIETKKIEAKENITIIKGGE